MNQSIYKAVKALGIPYTNHYSDLYIPVTDETTRLLKQYRAAGSQVSWSTFINRVEGGLWYDVPFAFLPYWDSRATKTKRN